MPLARPWSTPWRPQIFGLRAKIYLVLSNKDLCQFLERYSKVKYHPVYFHLDPPLSFLTASPSYSSLYCLSFCNSFCKDVVNTAHACGRISLPLLALEFSSCGVYYNRLVDEYENKPCGSIFVDVPHPHSLFALFLHSYIR